jgi:DUF4097 and DUF4098 domain-containing protein YvlB
VRVDAGRNGGIRVTGADRSDIAVQAVVRATARTDSRARQLAADVDVTAVNGRVSATGPDTSGREWWSVSYRLAVPRKNDLDLAAHNGGISIRGVHGAITFDTTNGGLELTDVGGRVRGQTRNGGVDVALAGTRWDGEALDVATTNGGVDIEIPEGYNAQLETGTVNGRFHTDFPMTVTGTLSRRSIRTTLGSGGAPIRVVTTNGGLRISRR